MQSTSIAAQLYTLREHTQTEDDLNATLARVREMGFSAAQVSAIGPIPAPTVAKLLNKHQLSCCATHVSIERLQKEPFSVIDELRSWGCTFTAIGGFFPKEPTLGVWQKFCDDFNEINGHFKGSGVTLGYHNHSHEFIRFGRQTAMQILLERLDPAIAFEIDTYWITHGGADPADWITRVKGRIPAVHLKDMGMRLQPREQFMMEVGEGNLNWPGILRACADAGVQWYIVEQDICYRDPFESLKISLNNLRAMH